MIPGASGAKAETSKLAYYEHIRASLRASIKTKVQLDDRLSRISSEIDALESKYRKETPAGNLVHGFDNYIRNVTSGTTTLGVGGAGRRKGQTLEVGSFFNRATQEPSTAAPKPAATPTTATGPGPKLGPKKRKSAVGTDGNETDSKPSKRGKVTYARE